MTRICFFSSTTDGDGIPYFFILQTRNIQLLITTDCGKKNMSHIFAIFMSITDKLVLQLIFQGDRSDLVTDQLQKCNI